MYTYTKRIEATSLALKRTNEILEKNKELMKKTEEVMKSLHATNERLVDLKEYYNKRNLSYF